MNDAISRRTALTQLTGIFALASLNARDWSWTPAKPFEHPEPRPGITAANVLPVEQLGRNKNVLEAYAVAREHPEILDGLYCVCECRDSMGHRSLLSCFESTQAMGCLGCRDQTELIAELLKDGKSLDDIRRAFDKKWGDHH
jgi:hypothetical protein